VVTTCNFILILHCHITTILSNY